jgi:hypothetical protein
MHTHGEFAGPHLKTWQNDGMSLVAQALVNMERSTLFLRRCSLGTIELTRD